MKKTFQILCFGHLAALCALLAGGCASAEVRRVHATAYCGCGQCCGWTRGSWKCLKLDLWNRYVASGPREGKPYDGRTANGTKPREPHPGLISVDSLLHPWMIPLRVVFFPWLLLPHRGTIAADAAYYPFGVKMLVPGYGWGVVEDRGSAIKGRDHIDLYFRSHRKARAWGDQAAEVRIVRPR